MLWAASRKVRCWYSHRKYAKICDLWFTVTNPISIVIEGHLFHSIEWVLGFFFGLCVLFQPLQLVWTAHFDKLVSWACQEDSWGREDAPFWQPYSVCLWRRQGTLGVRMTHVRDNNYLFLLRFLFLWQSPGIIMRDVGKSYQHIHFLFTMVQDSQSVLQSPSQNVSAIVRLIWHEFFHIHHFHCPKTADSPNTVLTKITEAILCMQFAQCNMMVVQVINVCSCQFSLTLNPLTQNYEIVQLVFEHIVNFHIFFPRWDRKNVFTSSSCQ